MFAARNSFMTASGIKTYPSARTGTIYVGSSPNAISFSGDGNYAYVSNQGGTTVSIITVSSNTVLKHVSVGGTPNAVATGPTSYRTFVAKSGSVSLILDNADYSYTNSNLSNTYVAVACTQTASPEAWFARAYSVEIVNSFGNLVTSVSPPNPCSNPVGMAMSPNNATAYYLHTDGSTGKVHVFNVSARTNTTSITVSNWASGLVLSPDGTKLYVCHETNKVTVINTATNAVSTSFTVGNDPKAIDISPDGARLYLANLGDNTISVIDTSTNTVTKTISLLAGSSPYAVKASPDNKKLYVANNGSGSVSVIT